MIADSPFWVRSKLSLFGLTTHLRTAAQTSRTKNTSARMSSVRQQRRREIVPDHVAKDIQDIAGREGEESPEDDEVGDARSVTERDALQDFTLTQNVRERTEQAAHWLVEPTRVLAQENQAEDSMVENESRRDKYPDCK